MAKKKYSGMRWRSPVVNGIFYPDNPETLTSMLSSWGLLSGEDHPASGSACGGQVILAPHGAWELTGNLAAAAFAAAQTGSEKNSRNINRVLLIGSRHCTYDEGIYLSESSYFETPLGEVPVDRNLNRALSSCSTQIRINDIPHLSEHSLEVLLPLVKYCFPSAKTIPIIMCGTRPALISGFSKALRIALEESLEESLVIISTNVSRNHDPELARDMADEFQTLLGNMDTQAFLSGLASGRISACGGAIIGAFLESGLLYGKYFTSLCPMVCGTDDNGETLYHGAFATAMLQ